MQMIGHQDISMYMAIMFFTGYLKFFQIKMVIRLTTKNLGTIVTTNDNMLRLPENDDSGEASHELDPKNNWVQVIWFLIENQSNLPLLIFPLIFFWLK